MEDYIIVNLNDDLYPNSLKEISNPPKKLYMKGNLNLLRENTNFNSWFKRLYKLWFYNSI